MGNTYMSDCVQAFSSIIIAICSILLVIVGFISLPKISKQVKTISNKLFNIKFYFCKNCPFASACVSPYLEEIGDFDKKDGIDNQDIADEIIKLYQEIKDFKFNKLKYTGSKDHQECLLRKLTMAINLLGGVNISFNRLKDEKEIEDTRTNGI